MRNLKFIYLIFNVTIGLLSTLILSCTSKNLVTVKIKYKIPIFDDNERKQGFLEDSFYVMSDNDGRVLFKIPGRKLTFKYENNTIEKVNSDVFFLFKTGDKNGLLFDSLTSTKPRNQNVDSFIIENTLSDFPLYDEIHLKVLEEKKLFDNSLRVVFTKTGITDKSFPDTAIYLFTRQNLNSYFSLSRELEEKKKLRLIKVNLIFTNRGINNEIVFQLQENINLLKSECKLLQYLK